MLRYRAWLPCLRPHISLGLKLFLPLHHLLCYKPCCIRVSGLAILTRQFANCRERIHPLRTQTWGKKIYPLHVQMCEFSFSIVRLLSSAGTFPHALQPFPDFLLTAKAWTLSSSSSFCLWAFPQPFPRQAGKEPEAPTQPTLLENQISDKKALSWGTNMKISSFGYFWLLWSPSPGSRCVCREPRSCVMAGICGVPNASKCMWAQVGAGIALICMHVFVWIDLLHPTSYLNTKQGPQLLAASLCLLFPGSLSPAGKWKENFNVGEAVLN